MFGKAITTVDEEVFSVESVSTPDQISQELPHGVLFSFCPASCDLHRALRDKTMPIAEDIASEAILAVGIE